MRGSIYRNEADQTKTATACQNAHLGKQMAQPETKELQANPPPSPSSPLHNQTQPAAGGSAIEKVQSIE